MKKTYSINQETSTCPRAFRFDHLPQGKGVGKFNNSKWLNRRQCNPMVPSGWSCSKHHSIHLMAGLKFPPKKLN